MVFCMWGGVWTWARESPFLVRMPNGDVGVVDERGPKPSASGRGSPIFRLVEGLGTERLLFACLTHLTSREARPSFNPWRRDRRALC